MLQNPFNNLKHVFPAFCKFFGPIGGQKLGNAHNSNKAKSGVSQIHLRQLFHFINVRCNYCLQLSLSYPRFLQTGLNRRFLFYKIASKEELYLKNVYINIFWKNLSNPNMRGLSTGVTSVTKNHCFSNN